MLHPEHQNAVDLLKDGKYDKALSILNKLIKKEPNNADFFSERGVVYYHLEQAENSINDMNKAADLEAENPYRYSSRAFIRDWMGDLHGAISDYEKTIEMDPDDAIAQNNLGMLQEKLGYKEKANDYYKRADKLSNIEKSMFNKMDSIEKGGERKPPPKKEALPKEKKSTWSIIKSVFSSREQRREFVRFIKNGFKFKDDEKRKS